MSTQNEKLATSLEHLHALQKQGKTAIRSRDLSRTHRERLCKNGFLQEVVKGWYVPAQPDEARGESTMWYASYLENRMGDKWCLSPEQSIAIHVQNWQVPKQLSLERLKPATISLDCHTIPLCLTLNLNCPLHKIQQS